MDRQLARPLGQLRSLDGHLRLAVRDSGFVLSNGLGWNADGTTMYFAETHARRIYRYAYDTRTGLPGARSVLVQAEEGPGGPDGLTVDAEGHVWCAMFDRGCVNRYSPDGELVQRLHLPVARPTSCALGGDDLKTLFITTAMHGLSPRELKEQPDAGRVLAVRVETPGLPEPDFAVDAVREFA
jgi:sugar lactone lactonase YvrE